MASPSFRPLITASHLRIGAFISIPRNASRTVVNVLGIGPNRDTETTDSLVIHENHQRGAVLRAKYGLQDLFTFCFVRNPLDRCISWYEGHRTMEPYLEPYRSLTFEEWIKAGLPHHWRRQNETSYLDLGISPLLQSTFTDGCRLDFVGRMENFDRDLATIVNTLNTLCAKHNIHKCFDFKNLKVGASSRAKSFAPYYTAQTKRIVYALLERDFEAFEYGGGRRRSRKLSA